MKLKLTLITIILLWIFVGCMQWKTVNGIIMEHHFNPRGLNDTQYITLIKTDDGFVEEQYGTGTYIIPIGQKVSVKVLR